MRAAVVFAALVAAAAASSACLTVPCNPKNLVADIVIMVDTSNALEPDQFEQVKTFLANFTQQLTVSPSFSQVAIYAYGLGAKSSGTLTSLASPVAVQSAIQAIQRTDSDDRNLISAIEMEEVEVTIKNGLREFSKKLLVVVAADDFNGGDVFNSQLDAVRAKYDAILAVGAGQAAVENAFRELIKLAGDKEQVFFAYNIDQLPFAGLWVESLACPGSFTTVKPTPPTTLPTPAPSVPCQLGSLEYDVYLLVDTSTSLTPTQFQQMKQQLYSFVATFPSAKTQFAMVSVSVDSELYYTGFHAGQTRAMLLDTINELSQDESEGQTLKLSLEAVQGAYLIPNVSSAKKMAVYFSGTTNFDQDPSNLSAQLGSKYGLSVLAVRWSAFASSSSLQSLTGGSGCVYDATSNPTGTAAWLQTAMCKSTTCH